MCKWSSGVIKVPSFYDDNFLTQFRTFNDANFCNLMHEAEIDKKRKKLETLLLVIIRREGTKLRDVVVRREAGHSAAERASNRVCEL